ncbi:thioredoxin family protein [Pedobacter foliorum]|uniref:thioredoxin family protein n=1 Tax=Pedobacter foliorum TaxID=2739058 RepID=UPI0015672441|nr:thioredoxin family protein [Pedobacter foliorum]NRF37205.1 thioredoxin family protein [Pedobacter foliorum]
MIIKLTHSQRLKIMHGMKHYFAALIILFSLETKAQESVGIQFEKKLTWSQVKEKAKKEKKMIFVDAYTTWCVPCKIMEKNIFPDKELGAFFNENFINVKVQFDKTKKDPITVKRWYKQVEVFQTQYNVGSYPTYFFFSPEGTLMHFIKGGGLTAKEFLEKSRIALEPKSQYITLKNQYKKGNRDSTFLLDLISVAKSARDLDSTGVFINSYLAVDRGWLKKQNLEFIAIATSKSSDIGFNFLLTHQAAIDSLLGKNKSAELLQVIAYDEIVLPMTRINGKKTSYGGTLVLYSGEIIKDVNWAAIKEKLDINYAPFSNEIIVNAKPFYYQGLNDWGNFCGSVSEAFDEKIIDLEQLNSYANTVLVMCPDEKYIKNALEWSEILVAKVNKETPGYYKTNALILYKLGQKDAAIKAMNQFIENCAVPQIQNEATQQLEKMKKGEAI